jgi:signal-transduction protein with cAMP-binding, CBS, and nucleotidyltransferase domain
MDNKFLMGVVLAIASIFGYVALALSGSDRLEAARGVFLFTTPFIAMLLGASAFEKINAKTDEIKQQTNGHLTKRIEDTADAAAEAAIKRVLEANKERLDL